MTNPVVRILKRTALLQAVLSIAAISLADWKIESNIPLGFLYLLPMVVVGGVLRRWQIALVAMVCTVLSEAFDNFEWQAGSGLPRDILYLAAFFGIGLFVFETTRSRKLAQLNSERLEAEMRARKDAEEQLLVFVETSPAAIITADAEGRVILANEAAGRLFGLRDGVLTGRSIGEFLPALSYVPASSEGARPVRTVMQCRGKRHSGEFFLADVWFSTYVTAHGARLAAMILDTSDDLRTREEASLHQLLAGSRILVGAMSHEIRNVCGAIAVVHANLAKDRALSQNQDFEALGTFISMLKTIAAVELRHVSDQASNLNLGELLDELRIVVEPSLAESGISVKWEVPTDLPEVWGDRQSLMQVFLNLIKNSERALQDSRVRELEIRADCVERRVIVQLRDTGGGVLLPDRLFRPFQPGASSTGLGLYLSRAFMRTFGGELRYEPAPGGSSFVVEIPRMLPGDEDAKQDSRSPDRRPWALPRESEPASRIGR